MTTKKELIELVNQQVKVFNAIAQEINDMPEEKEGHIGVQSKVNFDGLQKSLHLSDTRSMEHLHDVLKRRYRREGVGLENYEGNSYEELLTFLAEGGKKK